LADIHADEEEHREHGRSPLDELEKNVTEAGYKLAATETFASTNTGASDSAAPGEAYAQEIQALATARREVAQWNINNPEIVRRHALAEQAIKDAFMAVCAVEKQPTDERRWTPTVVEPGLPAVALTA